MKRTLALLIGMIVCASIARAGDAKVEAIMAMEKDGDPVTTFDASVPKIYALFKTEGVENGQKLRSVWIADDVGDAAPANTKIDEKTLNAEGDTDDGVFSLSKPTKGWPVGKYHIDIYVGDELATTVKFTIKGGKSKDAADDAD